MQGIEKTLRDTLGKLESPDEATRIKLYKATETILERSLAPYIESQPEMVAKRREQLIEIVSRLENEYQNPAAAPVLTPVPTPSPEQAPTSPQAPAPVAAQVSQSAPEPSAPPEVSVAPEPVITSDAPSVEPSRVTPRAQSSVDFPVVEPQRTPQDLTAPSVDTPQRVEPVAKAVPPVVSQSNTPVNDAPKVQTPADETVDLTSAPEIKPAQRSARSANVAWPDAATHPDRAEADVSALPAKGVDNVAEAKKSKADLRAEKRAKRLREHEEKRAKKKDNRRRGRSLIDTIAGSIVSVILIVFLIGGAWLFVESEYYELFVEWRNGGPVEVTAEGQVAQDDFIPKVLNESQEQVGDWIEVFGPADADKARGRGEVLVETIGDDNAGGVRITSVNPGEFGEALIPLNGRLLAPAASRKFALALSVSVTEPTQVYVRCLLKSGIEIGRRRFQLGGGRTDVLIDLDMTNVGAFETQPYLAINSDITGGGKSVELYDVRFQVQN
ncbi:MAG: hypothetical protein ABJN11_04040 [Lentilitoribacter sp.]